MRKMGNFKGLPVFMVTSPFEWDDIKMDHSCIYVYKTIVYYRNNRIAAINGDTLINFDEDLFNELRRKSWDDDSAQMLAHVTGSAETRSQKEETPTNETVKADTEALVDKDRRNWQTFADTEMAKLKAEFEKMEAELNAVG